MIKKLNLPIHDNMKGEVTNNQLEKLIALPSSLEFMKGEIKDPLINQRDIHPIMKNLLEYRRLEVSQSRLASRETYTKIRDKKFNVPIIRIRARLKR